MGPIPMSKNWISKDISGPPLHISSSLGFVQITVIMKFMISYMWTNSQHSKAPRMFKVKNTKPHPYSIILHGRRYTIYDLHTKPMLNENFTHPLHYMKMWELQSFNLRRFVLFFPYDDDPDEGVVGPHQLGHVRELLLDGLRLHLQLQWRADPLCRVATQRWYGRLALQGQEIVCGIWSEIRNMRLALWTAGCVYQQRLWC